MLKVRTDTLAAHGAATVVRHYLANARKIARLVRSDTNRPARVVLVLSPSGKLRVGFGVIRRGPDKRLPAVPRAGKAPDLPLALVRYEMSALRDRDLPGGPDAHREAWQSVARALEQAGAIDKLRDYIDGKAHELEAAIERVEWQQKEADPDRWRALEARRQEIMTQVHTLYEVAVRLPL
jgi:hypothetical protein